VFQSQITDMLSREMPWLSLYSYNKYIQTCIHIYACIYINVCTYIYIHVYIHTYICIHVHIYTHIQTLICTPTSGLQCFDPKTQRCYVDNMGSILKSSGTFVLLVVCNQSQVCVWGGYDE